MAITNLGGGGYRTTADPTAGAVGQRYGNMQAQNTGLIADFATKQKELNDQLHAQAMQELASTYLETGQSLGDAITDNYDQFLLHTTALMGGNEEGARQYLDSQMSGERSIGQIAARQAYTKARTQVAKGDPMLDYLATKTIPVDKPTVTPGKTETLDLSLGGLQSKLKELVDSGMSPEEALIKLPASMAGVDPDTFSSTGNNKNTWLDTRAELWKELNIPGAYVKEAGQDNARDNRTLALTILQGGYDRPMAEQTPAGPAEIPVKPSIDGKRAMELAAMTPDQLEKQEEAIANPDIFKTLINRNPAVAGAENSPQAVAQRAGTIMQGYQNLPDPEFSQGSFMAGENFSDRTKDMQRTDIERKLNFQFPSTTSDTEVEQTYKVMESGILSQYHNTLRAIGEQGGSAITPRLYDAFIKEVSDKLDISDKEATIALKNAQTMSYLQSLNPQADPEIAKLSTGEQSIIDNGYAVLRDPENQIEFQYAPDGVTLSGISFPSNLAGRDKTKAAEIRQRIESMNAVFSANPGIATQTFQTTLEGQPITVIVPSSLGRATVGSMGTTGTAAQQQLSAEQNNATR